MTVCNLPLRRLCGAILVVAAVLAAGPVSAQEPLPAPPAAAAPADTVASDLPSARGALLRSLVLPGWGQSYVGSPGRGALFFALEAGSLWMTYRTSRALSDARRAEDWLRSTGRLAEDEPFGLAESREEQREDWIALSLFWILAAGADAYVAAQLADFDDHLGVRPTPGGGLRLEARVPFGGRP